MKPELEVLKNTEWQEQINKKKYAQYVSITAMIFSGVNCQ